MTDWMEQERERGITITSAATTCAWTQKQGGRRLQDFRRHQDARQHHRHARPRGFHGRSGAFAARARWRDRGFRCASPACSRNPKPSGVRRTNINVPRIAFINKMDRVGADFEMSIDTMRKKLGANAWPILIPLGKEDYLKGQLDVVNQKAVILSRQRLDGLDLRGARHSRGEQGRRSTRPTTIWSSRFPISTTRSPKPFSKRSRSRRRC